MTERKEMHDKPLDKMTVTELREVAKELPDITGVHGMKKAELLAAVQEAQGAPAEPAKTQASKPQKQASNPQSKTAVTHKELKALIRGLRSLREQALADKDKKMAKIYRRRISRLKKKTRQAA